MDATQRESPISAADLMPTGDDDLAVLQQRAVTLAESMDSQAALSEVVDLLHVRLSASADLAIPYHNLVEALPEKDITIIPRAPGSVLGVINLSGRLVTVLNLAAILHLQQDSTDAEALVVVASGGTTVAFPVSELVESLHAPADGIGTAPHSTATKRGYVTGVVDGNVAVLDIDRILSDKTLLVNQ